MGSFSELVLSFEFREDVPDYVLAAFSKLHEPQPQRSYPTPEPSLPPPVQEYRFGVELIGEAAVYESDDVDPDEEEAFRDEPWRHDWANELSGTMSVATEPYGRLVWTGSCWRLQCCSSWKTIPDAVHAFLTWLGPYIEDLGGKAWVGTVIWEQDERPCLLWVEGGVLTIEDLNPPGWPD